MPVKYIDDKTGHFLNSQAMQESGAPRVYGIKTIEDLVSTSLNNKKL